MQPMKILVLDDDQDLAESLVDILEARGHEVALAFNGTDALALFRAQEFDIAFMDVRMPGMNGVETFLEMRKIKPDAKAIMMTAFSVVLVADDDPDFTDSVAPILSGHGYRCLVASDGQEAVDGVLRNDVDVLILDLNLPVLSGIEVYLELQRLSAALPTIIVTGAAFYEADKLDAVKSLSTSGCLHKPVDPDQLLRLVDSLGGQGPTAAAPALAV